MRSRIFFLWFCTLLFVLAGCSPLLADNDRVQFAKSIHVAQDESVGDVVCIGCSIYMEGKCGDVVAIGGSMLVDGDVKGDAVAVGGSIRLNDNAVVNGDVVTVGGRLSRDPDAVVRGTTSSQSGIPILIALVLVPLLPVILIVALIVWLMRRDRRPAQTQPYQQH